MKRQIVLICLTILLLTQLVQARSLDAIAVHPAGKYVATGGENRVLYILSTTTLQVTKRIWIQARITHLTFNKSGNRLVVKTDEKAIIFYDTQTWKPVNKITEKVNKIFLANPLANVAVYGLRKFGKSAFNLISLDDGKVLQTIELAQKTRIASVGFNVAGTQLALLSRKMKDESETKEQTPRELKNKARYEFSQHHDGYKTKLIVYDLKQKKAVKEHSLWYAPFGSSGELVIGEKGEVFIISYAHGNLKVSTDNTAELFVLPNSYCYGKGFSANGKVLASGGLRKGSVTNLKTMQSISFKLDKLPGFPEYFVELAVARNGKTYATTDAYRIIEISKEGKILKVAPVY